MGPSPAELAWAGRMVKVLPKETENSAACRDGPVPSRKVDRDGHVLCVGQVDRLWRLVGDLELESRMLSGIQSSRDVLAGPVSKPTATWQKEGQEDADYPLSCRVTPPSSPLLSQAVESQLLPCFLPLLVFSRHEVGMAVVKCHAGAVG